MSFKLSGKVALITGGASGIGLRYAKELLKNGLKGVTLADTNENFAKSALSEIEKEHGAKKAIFVKTDVTNIDNFDNAFKKTITEFKNVDILINNAGIMNDKIWKKQIDININGTIHGILLGLETYIPKYKSSDEGVIINISSIAGIKPYPVLPIYTGTKFAVFGMTKAWGYEGHYERTKVRVVGICPGITETPLITEMAGKNLGPQYEELNEKITSGLIMQKPESVASAMVEIIKNAKSGTCWVAENDKAPYEFILPDREIFAANLK